jgi:hypothetical protein
MTKFMADLSPQQQEQVKNIKRDANGRIMKGTEHKKGTSIGGKTLLFTEGYILAQLEDILFTIKEDQNIVFLSQIFEQKSYSQKRFMERVREYSEKNYDISELANKINEILQDRIALKGLLKDFNPIMAIFCLKNNYNWKDSHENINISKEDDTIDEETKKILDSLRERKQ